MANFTKFYNLPFPDENQDPYFETQEQFYNFQDQTMYGLLAAQQPIVGGGFIGFTNLSIFPSPFIGQLTWTDDFHFLIPGSSFMLNINYGPDNATRVATLNEGDRIYCNIPLTAAMDVTTNFKIINGPITIDRVQLQGFFTLGVYRAGQFFSNLPRVFP